MKECEIIEGQDPFKVSASGISWIKARELKLDDIWKKSNACNDMVEDVLMLTPIKNVPEMIESCKKKDFRFIDENTCEKVLKNEERYLKICDVANKNMLNLHYLANTLISRIYDDIISRKPTEEIKKKYDVDDAIIDRVKKLGPNIDIYTGTISRYIEDSCLTFPLVKKWVYEHKGKPVLEIEYVVDQYPDEFGRYSELVFYEINKKTGKRKTKPIGKERCIWATETARPSDVAYQNWLRRIEELEEKGELDLNDPNQRNEILDEVSKSLEKASTDLKRAIPRQDLFFHGISAYGGWIETGFDPTQHTLTTVFNTFPILVRADPEIVEDILIKLIENADPESIKNGVYKTYLERFHPYISGGLLSKLFNRNIDISLLFDKKTIKNAFPEVPDDMKLYFLGLILKDVPEQTRKDVIEKYKELLYGLIKNLKFEIKPKFVKGKKFWSTYKIIISYELFGEKKQIVMYEELDVKFFSLAFTAKLKTMQDFFIKSVHATFLDQPPPFDSQKYYIMNSQSVLFFQYDEIKNKLLSEFEHFPIKEDIKFEMVISIIKKYIVKDLLIVYTTLHDIDLLVKRIINDIQSKNTAEVWKREDMNIIRKTYEKILKSDKLISDKDDWFEKLRRTYIADFF